MLRLRNTLEKGLGGAGVVLMLTALLLISLVGKNVTYTTRFTPPNTEASLRNSTYFAEVQVLILIFAAVLVLLLPFLGYSILAKSKRIFFPLWVGFLATMALLLLLSLYYLAGANRYRDYLGQLEVTVQRQEGYCEESVCNRVTCARLNSYYDSRRMAIAFSVIGLVCAAIIAVAGFVVNLRRRKTNEIELII